MPTLRSFAPLLLLLICVQSARAEIKITPDVVYGHKAGLAMTFDVFTPTEEPNGAGVLFMVSGGWYSGWTPPEQMQALFSPLTDAGFTVFAVRHGSSPKFTIPEAVDDVRRSVRFIRRNAEQFGVDPNRLGVYGGSAGGHLSLMLGTASDEGDANAKDPVLQVSDRVQAVVALVAPTDLQVMAWSNPDHMPVYEKFPALELELEEAKTYSPLVHVTPDDAPTLLIVGAKDELVPISHSQNIEEAFEKENVTSELIVFDEAGHGFQGDDQKRATAEMVQWFQTHLTK